METPCFGLPWGWVYSPCRNPGTVSGHGKSAGLGDSSTRWTHTRQGGSHLLVPGQSLRDGCVILWGMCDMALLTGYPYPQSRLMLNVPMAALWVWMLKLRWPPGCGIISVPLLIPFLAPHILYTRTVCSLTSSLKVSCSRNLSILHSLKSASTGPLQHC